MQSYEVNSNKQIMLQVDSFGSQKKFRDGDKWYKVDLYGEEGKAEEMCSILLSCITNIPEGVEFVKYESCLINGEKGCASNNFLNDGESLISFQTLHWNLRNMSIEDVLTPKNDTPVNTEDSFIYVKDFVQYATGLDVRDYLKTVMALDYITLNPDRHFGNLNVIRKADGTYRQAPIFDNGQALGQNHLITPRELPYRTKAERLKSKTFSNDFEEQVNLTGYYLNVNVAMLDEQLKHKEPSSARDFLSTRITDLERKKQMSRSIYERFH